MNISNCLWCLNPYSECTCLEDDHDDYYMDEDHEENDEDWG